MPQEQLLQNRCLPNNVCCHKQYSASTIQLDEVLNLDTFMAGSKIALSRDFRNVLSHARAHTSCCVLVCTNVALAPAGHCTAETSEGMTEGIVGSPPFWERASSWTSVQSLLLKYSLCLLPLPLCCCRLLVCAVCIPYGHLADCSTC